MPNTLSHLIKQQARKIWVQHLLFWLALIALFALFRTLRDNASIFTWKTLFFEIIPFSGVASAVYLNYKLLLPRFLVKKRYWIYISLLLSITWINAAIVHTIFRILEPYVREFGHQPHPKVGLFFPAYMTLQIIFTMITSFFYFVRENSRLNEIALSTTEIESQRLAAELNSLKAQINPHFLFNTLNNIYSYSLLESERTPAMILKLSGLMNYIIYECRAEQVALDKEIQFIHNYIALEKLRVEDNLKILVDIPDDIPGQTIAPLLFVPLLENAFKHGANIQNPQPYIRIGLNISSTDLLTFTCENLKDSSELQELPEKSGGIGLENVKKRLELLYPGKNHLSITELEDRFSVTLTIQLEEQHV